MATRSRRQARAAAPVEEVAAEAPTTIAPERSRSVSRASTSSSASDRATFIPVFAHQIVDAKNSDPEGYMKRFRLNTASAKKDYNGVRYFGIEFLMDSNNWTRLRIKHRAILYSDAVYLKAKYPAANLVFKCDGDSIVLADALDIIHEVAEKLIQNMTGEDRKLISDKHRTDGIASGDYQTHSSKGDELEAPIVRASLKIERDDQGKISNASKIRSSIVGPDSKPIEGLQYGQVLNDSLARGADVATFLDICIVSSSHGLKLKIEAPKMQIKAYAEEVEAEAQQVTQADLDEFNSM